MNFGASVNRGRTEGDAGSATRHRIQNLVFPSMAFGAPEDMYVRLHNSEVRASYNTRSLMFEKGGKASFDTFFSSLTLGVWRGPCPIDDVALVLRGCGRFLVRFGIHRLNVSHRYVLERELTLDAKGNAAVHLSSLDDYRDGMLYAEITALSDGELQGGFFETSTQPKKTKVELGIVVTHFNRIQYVVPAIERLHSELFTDPEYRDKIKLVVIDNSRNLPLRSTGQITIIPSANYGGSGGFTRGLLHLQDHTTSTHCLFMDDDASCEVESIRRTLHLLEFGGVERFAVSGALLREVEPARLYEKGAGVQSGKLRPFKNDLNLCGVHDLLLAERTDRKVDYGAWWHFAFALDDVKHFAYPFFVRGDDVLFSLQNKFNIVTLNGIASWGEDFHYKDSPMTRYLAARSELLLWFESRSVSRSRCFKALLMVHAASLFSYNYASARAITMAIQDVLKGPDFWTANLDAAEPRARIASFAGFEKMLPMTEFNLDMEHAQPRESALRMLFRWLTLNGILIPTGWMKNRTVYQPKASRARLRDIFRYRRVLYYYEPANLGYVAEHDKKQFFTELGRFLKTTSRLMLQFDRLQQTYREAIDRLTQRKFWEDVYAEADRTLASEHAVTSIALPARIDAFDNVPATRNVEANAR